MGFALIMAINFDIQGSQRLSICQMNWIRHLYTLKVGVKLTHMFKAFLTSMC